MPLAQAQDEVNETEATEAEDQESTTEQSPAPQPVMIPKERLDEVLAQNRELQAMASGMLETQRQLMARVAQSENREKPEELPDPLAGLDEEEAKRLKPFADALVERVTKPLLKRIDAMERSSSSQIATTRFESLKADFEDRPEVLELAERIMQTWQHQGRQGWWPEDAIRLAVGELAIKERQKNKRPANERQKFNRQAPPPIVGQRTAPKEVSETEVDVASLPLNEQIAHWEKKLDNKTF